MSAVQRLLEIMARLRDPEGGCPWDLEQDFASIAPYTLEEAYEVEDAIRRGDFEGLRDELGDLLLQVVYHARMAEEAGRFGFDDVVEGICDKLVRRHPHVFGDAVIRSAEAQTHSWEALKAEERERASGGPAGSLAGVPLALPALVRATKLQRRAARLGFDGPADASAAARLEAQLGELATPLRGDAPRLRLEAVLGDLLFAAADLARRRDIDPEAALRAANARFEARFGAMEQALASRGVRPETLAADEWLALWREVGSEEAGEPTW